MRPSSVPRAASLWLRSAQRSCAAREMWFSLAIFSADWPIDSPVEGSAIAGDTGTRSRGRIRLSVRRRVPSDFALLASTRMSARRREARIGMSESDSTPPASATSASPSTISSYALATACPEDAHARFREWAGISLGNWGRRLTSRATFGTSADATTCPKITASTSAPARSVRSSSSRATKRARSTARTSLSAVPERQKGVRQPATMATRRPFPAGITFFSALTERNLPPSRRAGQAGGTPTNEPEFSHRTRAKALTAMAAEPVDVLVVGGGITGAGIARDAALRGFRTAVVDKGDFASGTSSHSSRLIHGGLRYLEQYEFHLVREASRERRVLLKVAPHLVRPLPFVLPAYRGARVPAWRLRAGLWLYDLLAGFRNVGLHRWLGRKATLRLEPGLRDKDLRGAAVYFDAQTDDARLTLATMRAAAPAGPLVASHADLTALLQPAGPIRGAAVRAKLSRGGRRRVRAALRQLVLPHGAALPPRRRGDLGRSAPAAPRG